MDGLSNDTSLRSLWLDKNIDRPKLNEQKNAFEYNFPA